MSKINWKIVVPLLLIGLVAGGAVGAALPFDAVRKKVASWITTDKNKSDQTENAAQTHEEIVEVSYASMDNLGIKFGRVKTGNYQTSYEIAARVTELPGVSELHITSRFDGIVKQMFVTQGQTVVAGQKICELELTSESLATAQSEFLDHWQQLSIIESEIDRLTPLLEQGGVASKRLIQLKYEKKRTQAKSDSKIQELLVRGLSKQQIDEIKSSKKLIRSIFVRVGKNLLPPQRDNHSLPTTETLFVVGNILGQPGSMVKKGEHLCEIAYHQQLVVVGYAFELDLPQIEKLIRENTPVEITIGGKEKHIELKNQRIAYVSNHADAETNTFPFYVYIKNEMINEKITSSVPQFISWRWKPGQRAHIDLPSKTFKDKIILPRSAVATEGVVYFAFREHEHDHAPGESHEHAGVELEPFELNVLHIDRNFAVVEPSDEIKSGDIIIVTQAEQVLFALRNSGGGGGHSHPH